MKARVEKTRRLVGRRARLAFALAGAVMAALLVVGLTSAANPSTQGLFELDGNGVTTASSTSADWNCLFGNTANCPATQPPAKTHVPDPVADTGDDILGQGSKDILPISGWTRVTQKAPAKDDLANAAWANYTGPQGHDFVYFAADRISNNGDAFLGFWFFKDKVGVSNGAISGQHQVGDILVLVNFIQGKGSAKISGGTQEIGVYKWVGSGGDVSGTLETLVPLTQGTCPATGDACAIFNTTNQTSTWPFQSTDSGDPANTWTGSEFVEGGIDLTQLLGDQGCFSTVMAETRASDSPTAEQKDITLGSLNTCGTVKVVKDAVPNDPRSWGFSASPGDPNALTPSTFSLVDNGGATNVQEFDNVNPGTYHVTEDLISALGWANSDISCDDANGTSPSSGDVASRTATINVSASEVVTCTFTNTFTKATPQISTSASGPVTVGGKIHDVATLSGANGATGDVTFQVFAPGDATCATPLQTLATSTKSVDGNGNGTYTSADFTTAADGDYHWRAFFAGDTKNNAVSGACNAEGETSTALKPGILIDKSTSTPTILSGGTATFSITVTNTGQVTLTNVHVTDALAPDCVKTLGTMAPGASSTYSCTLANVTQSLTNVAVATGTPPEGPDQTASDDADVTVVHPGISLTKTTSTPQLVTGGTAVFEITVTNTGDIDLTNVNVTDAQAPGCARTAAQVAADRGSSTLAPDESYQYTCELANVTASLTNVATATGTATPGGDQTATDEADVTVQHPAIAITKGPATQAVNSGSTATFQITVTNTGDVTLTNVTVTDPLSTGCAKTVGTLAPGQSSSYSCTQPGVTAAFTNVATATGHPPLGPDVTASANAKVTVNTPSSPPPSSPPPAATPAPVVVTDLAVVKTASPTSVLRGKNVTYTLTVTNNGPATDTNVQVADSLPAGVNFVSVTPSAGTCSSGNLVQCNLGTLTNGQKVTITIVVNTVGTGTITNTATVVGALPETTLANNTSSTPINVTAPPKPKPKPVFKPPVKHKPKPKPVVHKPVPPPCYAVVVAPKSLSVGKAGALRLRVSAKSKAIAGVRVKVTGPGILKLSGRTNKAGKVTITLHPKKPGIVLVKPASHKGCTAPRVGVIAAFTPPVTG